MILTQLFFKLDSKEMRPYKKRSFYSQLESNENGVEGDNSEDSDKQDTSTTSEDSNKKDVEGEKEVKTRKKWKRKISRKQFRHHDIEIFLPGKHRTPTMLKQMDAPVLQIKKEMAKPIKNVQKPTAVPKLDSTDFKQSIKEYHEENNNSNNAPNNNVGRHILPAIIKEMPRRKSRDTIQSKSPTLQEEIKEVKSETLSERKPESSAIKADTSNKSPNTPMSEEAILSKARTYGETTSPVNMCQSATKQVRAKPLEQLRTPMTKEAIIQTARTYGGVQEQNSFVRKTKYPESIEVPREEPENLSLRRRSSADAPVDLTKKINTNVLDFTSKPTHSTRIEIAKTSSDPPVLQETSAVVRRESTKLGYFPQNQPPNFTQLRTTEQLLEMTTLLSILKEKPFNVSTLASMAKAYLQLDSIKEQVGISGHTRVNIGHVLKITSDYIADKLKSIFGLDPNVMLDIIKILALPDGDIDKTVLYNNLDNLHRFKTMKLTDLSFPMPGFMANPLVFSMPEVKRPVVRNARPTNIFLPPSPPKHQEIRPEPARSNPVGRPRSKPNRVAINKEVPLKRSISHPLPMAYPYDPSCQIPPHYFQNDDLTITTTTSAIYSHLPHHRLEPGYGSKIKYSPPKEPTSKNSSSRKRREDVTSTTGQLVTKSLTTMAVVAADNSMQVTKEVVPASCSDRGNPKSKDIRTSVITKSSKTNPIKQEKEVDENNPDFLVWLEKLKRNPELKSKFLTTMGVVKTEPRSVDDEECIEIVDSDEEISIRKVDVKPDKIQMEVTRMATTLPPSTEHKSLSKVNYIPPITLPYAQVREHKKAIYSPEIEPISPVSNESSFSYPKIATEPLNKDVVLRQKSTSPGYVQKRKTPLGFDYQSDPNRKSVEFVPDNKRRKSLDRPEITLSPRVAPSGKLCYVRESHSFLRYFDDTQAELFIKNLSSHDEELLRTTGIDPAKLKSQNHSNFNLDHLSRTEVLPLPPGVEFSKKAELTEVEEFVKESSLVERFVPKDFADFYRYVTGFQIIKNKHPVSLQTFLTMYNTNRTTDLLRKYLQRRDEEPALR